MTKRKRLPKYYGKMARQLHYIILNGYPEERSGMRIIISGLFRFVSHRLKSFSETHSAS